MATVMPKADHSRNSSPFSDFKHFVCSTCQKCVFNANPDACITKFLKEVNSHAKIQPNKTRNSNKPIDPTSHTQKPGRKIVTGHSFSPNKSSVVHEKTNTPRSYLRWMPTGRIFNTAGLKWVPTGKTFTSSTTKVDCELPNGSNDYITNPYKCDQTLNVSAGTLNLSADQHPCFMIMVSVDNTSGPAPQRKEECTLQCALSSKEEKSSCILILERVNCVLRISGLYTLRLLDASCKKVLNLLKKGLLKVKATLKSAWTEKDQINNLLKESRLMRSLEKFVGGKLFEGDLQLRQKNHMILSYDVLINQKDSTLQAGNPAKEILLKMNLLITGHPHIFKRKHIKKGLEVPVSI
ncbi:hypothetical protein Tco_0503087 [Tanacetum coccineum]